MLEYEEINFKDIYIYILLDLMNKDKCMEIISSDNFKNNLLNIFNDKKLNSKFEFQNDKFFVKKDIESNVKEIIVNYCKNYSKLPLLELKFIVIYDNISYFFYSYYNQLDLLHDSILFNNYYEYKVNLLKLFDILHKTFLETEEITISSNLINNQLFLNRLELIEFRYINDDKSNLYKILDKKFIINNKILNISLKEMYNETRNFFLKSKTIHSVISQGDFHEMNISLKPLLFDINLLGENSTNGEFAVFMWATMIQEEYFLPKYNSNHFSSSKCLLINNLDFIEIKLDKKNIILNYRYNFSNNRKIIINEYIKIILLKLKKYNLNEIKNLKYYFFMRVLGVSDLNFFNQEDTHLSLALLGEIWHFFSNIEKKEDLINFFDIL